MTCVTAPTSDNCGRHSYAERSDLDQISHPMNSAVDPIGSWDRRVYSCGYVAHADSPEPDPIAICVQPHENLCCTNIVMKQGEGYI